MELTSDLIAQGGAAAVLLAVLIALITGKLRTAQEVEAWKARAERDEQLLDQVLPAIDRLTDAVNSIIRVHTP